MRNGKSRIIVHYVTHTSELWREQVNDIIIVPKFHFKLTNFSLRTNFQLGLAVGVTELVVFNLKLEENLRTFPVISKQIGKNFPRKKIYGEVSAELHRDFSSKGFCFPQNP